MTLNITMIFLERSHRTSHLSQTRRNWRMLPLKGKVQWAILEPRNHHHLIWIQLQKKVLSCVNNPRTLPYSYKLGVTSVHEKNEIFALEPSVNLIDFEAATPPAFDPPLEEKLQLSSMFSPWSEQNNLGAAGGPSVTGTGLGLPNSPSQPNKTQANDPFDMRKTLIRLVKFIKLHL